MNLGEIKSEVFRRLDESESASVFWTESDVEDAVNDGYRELADATEWHEVWDVFYLYGDTIYYDTRTFLSKELLAPRRARNVETGQWLKMVDVRDLDFRTFTEWETITGDADRFFMRGAHWLGIWPMESADNATRIKLYYTSMPESLDTDADEPDIPDEYQMALVEYAAYDLLAQSAETRKALLHWQQYQALEEGLRRYVQQRMSLDRVEKNYV